MSIYRGAHLKRSSLIMIALVGLLCLLFAIGGASYPKGAGLFPMVVGSLGFLTAVICLFLQRPGVNSSGEEPEKLNATSLWAIGMTFAYPLLVFLLGYVIGTISFTVAVMGTFRNKPKVLLSFVGLIVGLWAVFSKVLLLRMPVGIVWQIFS